MFDFVILLHVGVCHMIGQASLSLCLVSVVKPLEMINLDVLRLYKVIKGIKVISIICIIIIIIVIIIVIFVNCI